MKKKLFLIFFLLFIFAPIGISNALLSGYDVFDTNMPTSIKTFVAFLYDWTGRGVAVTETDLDTKIIDPNQHSIPAPVTLLLIATGVIGFIGVRRRDLAKKE